MRRAALIGSWCGLLFACHERIAPAPSPSQGGLPELAGLVSEPLTTGDRFIRRTYRVGAERITVTLARLPLPESGWQGWLRMSQPNYPQAVLDAPPDAANGFYQCAPNDATRCDLLIQTRNGAHLEIRGEAGTAERENVDALIAKLPLREIATQ